MNETPKISVIVPVFNVQPYLKECIDSILAQTLTDIEVLCGDGGSTDGSLEILRDYEEKDSRVRVLNKAGSGYGQSVNDCMRIAKGKYIGIVESDDLIVPDMYETLYKIAEEKALDWVRGDIYFFRTSEFGKPKLRYEKIIIGNFYNTVLNPQKDARPYRCRLRTWSGIYRRDFINNHNIQHNETFGAAYQDAGFYLKTLFYAERVSFVPKAFYLWRQDNTQSSIHFDSAHLVERSMKEWKLNEEYIATHHELGIHALCGFRYRQFLAYMWTIDCAGEKEKQQVKKEANKMLMLALEKGEIERQFFTRKEWAQLRLFLRTGETMNICKRIYQWIKKQYYRLIKIYTICWGHIL